MRRSLEVGRAVAHGRSALFVPGSRPDRFSKALNSGADFVIIDLEDAVAPSNKKHARQDVVNWIRAKPEVAVAVRINSPHDRLGMEDLTALAGLCCPIVLPKFDHPADVALVLDRVGTECPIVGLVETASGLVRIDELVHVPGLSRLAFGNVDLATELAVRDSDYDALRYARSKLVLHAAAAGLPRPLDGVTTEIRNTRLLEAECAQAHRLGFAGKLCIHPAQVPTVNESFTPTQQDVIWATKIIGSSESGVTVVDGAMVDAPVIRKARQILSRAKLAGKR